MAQTILAWTFGQVGRRRLPQRSVMGAGQLLPRSPRDGEPMPEGRACRVARGGVVPRGATRVPILMKSLQRSPARDLTDTVMILKDYDLVSYEASKEIPSGGGPQVAGCGEAWSATSLGRARIVQGPTQPESVAGPPCQVGLG